MYYALLPSLEVRTRLIADLRGRGILAVFHYQPLHLSPMGLEFGGAPGRCPVTEDVADRLVRLPFYTGLTEPEQAAVIDAVLAFRA
jgi:dTDP-4-amino-4,6-dideoxygalactose transaminase